MRRHLFDKSNGFTVIEVLAVIVLVTLLSYAFLAYYRHSDTELVAQTNVLKTHIRYAQARAMNTSTHWGIRYQTSENAYWLFQDPNINERIPLPGQTTDTVDLNSKGLTISGADFSLTFDSWGRPAATNRTFTGRQLIFNLNRDGTEGDPITITENTGFIP